MQSSLGKYLLALGWIFLGAEAKEKLVLFQALAFMHTMDFQYPFYLCPDFLVEN